MRATLAVLLVGASALAAEPPVTADQKPRLVVTDLAPLRVAPEEAQALTDAVVTWLTARSPFDVVSTRDVQAILGAERQRQLLGTCGDDGAGCSKDLSALLNARFLLSGQLARVGSAWQLTLQMADTERAQPVGRSSKLAGSLEALRALVPYAAAEATGAPLPPPPSRVLPVTLMAAGATAVLSGGAVGLLALSRQGQLNDELCPGGPLPDGRCTGTGLQTREFYAAQDAALAGQKWLAAGLMVAGAALFGVGLWLLPPEDARTRVSAVVVPGAEGLAVVGSF